MIKCVMKNLFTDMEVPERCKQVQFCGCFLSLFNVEKKIRHLVKNTSHVF